MRVPKLVVLSTALTALAMVSQAVTITGACANIGGVGSNTFAGTGSTSPSGLLASTAIADLGAGTYCTIGDKAIGNFTVSGTIEPGAEFSVTGTGPGPYQFNISDTSSAGLNTAFTLSYSIIVNESAATVPGWFAITAAGSGGVADSLTATNAVDAESVNQFTDSADFGAINYTSSGSGTQNPMVNYQTNTITSNTISGLEAQGLNVTDTYTYTQGHITGLNNSFIQTNESTTPEPSTMVLMGAALMGLGAIGRKKLSRKA